MNTILIVLLQTVFTTTPSNLNVLVTREPVGLTTLKDESEVLVIEPSNDADFKYSVFDKKHNTWNSAYMYGLDNDRTTTKQTKAGTMYEYTPEPHEFSSALQQTKSTPVGIAKTIATTPTSLQPSGMTTTPMTVQPSGMTTAPTSLQPSGMTTTPMTVQPSGMTPSTMQSIPMAMTQTTPVTLTPPAPMNDKTRFQTCKAPTTEQSYGQSYNMFDRTEPLMMTSPRTGCSQRTDPSMLDMSGAKQSVVYAEPARADMNKAPANMTYATPTKEDFNPTPAKKGTACKKGSSKKCKDRKSANTNENSAAAPITLIGALALLYLIVM